MTKPSKAQVFRQRLGSTLVLWTVVLLALFAPNDTVANTAFLAITSILGFVGFREFARMLETTGVRVFLWPAMVAGSALLLFEVSHGWNTSRAIEEVSSSQISNAGSGQTHTTIYSATGIHFTLVTTLLFLWLSTLKLRSAGAVPIASLALTFFGWFYVFGLLTFIAKIYYFPGLNGSWLLLYFILVTKFSDLGAYVTGSLIGRHKMAPKISPGKTWEGFAGAIVISTLVSLITIYLAGPQLAPLQGIHGVLLGILLGGLAVVGDLIESLLKRETGVKDSGNLFPGIGGCLDLLDSLLFNAPIFYLYCRLTLTN